MTKQTKNFLLLLAGALVIVKFRNQIAGMVAKIPAVGKFLTD